MCEPRASEPRAARSCICASPLPWHPSPAAARWCPRRSSPWRLGRVGRVGRRGVGVSCRSLGRNPWNGASRQMGGGGFERHEMERKNTGNVLLAALETGLKRETSRSCACLRARACVHVPVCLCACLCVCVCARVFGGCPFGVV